LPRLENIRGFAALAPASNGRPHYDLILDSAEYPRRSAAALADQVDRALRDNPQYDYARKLRQLDAVTARAIARPLERYYARELSRGRRAGDIKPPVLLFEDAV
ncbi:MAG: GH3 family domain-containing protein, partial [Longimicrobiales bacterium]